MIGLRLSKEDTARLDKRAWAMCCTRSEAIRAAIELWLQHGDPNQPGFKSRRGEET
jgi:predicted transcriptional regulator